MKLADEAVARARRLLVLGLGNTILTDDGAGIYLLRAIRENWDQPGVDFAEASLAGLGLLDIIAGYDALVILDSFPAGDGEPGEVCELDVHSLSSTVRLTGVHDINLATALELGRRMGIRMPEEVRIYVIRASDVYTLGERCTPEVEAAIPAVADLVAERIKEMMPGTTNVQGWRR